ncbi:MAG: HlyD family efflux transporter periplasmic adaptor subunit [Microscillaceae bacterium]|nr:HlyD family efflux transporter periplasmic adaptor subunit [Microscillaceae bacterium]
MHSSIQPEELANIRSEEVQEILSRPPAVLLRWGIPALLFIFLGFLGLSALIRYPDVLQADALITTNPPPVKIFARSSGALKLLVEDGENIRAGGVLGYIQNPTDWQKVQKLEKILIHWDEQKFIEESRLFDSGLGELQTYYNQLLQAYQERAIVKKHPLSAYNAAKLREHISQKQHLTQNLQEKYQLDQRIFEQSQKSYLVDSLLYAQKVKTPIELYQARNEYLRQLQNLKNSETGLLNHDEQLQEIETRIGELDMQILEQSDKLDLAIEQAYRNLQTQIILWKARYVLSCPLEGKVSLLQYWSDNQYISGEQEVMSIVPATKSQIVKVYLPIQGAGKAKAGQKVWLSLYDYPEAEFGKLEGSIIKVSPLAQKDAAKEETQYVLDVRLIHQLRTDRGKTLTFKPEMEGEASIITQPYSLLERIVNPLRKLISRK